MALKAETERFIMAAKDQSLYTKNYQTRIMKNRVYDETVDQLVFDCPAIRPTEYKNRHNRVSQYILWKICQHYQAPYHKKWYEHKLEPVVETVSATIFWDFAIHTDRKIDKLILITLTLQLTIIKTTPVYWLS